MGVVVLGSYPAARPAFPVWALRWERIAQVYRVRHRAGRTSGGVERREQVQVVSNNDAHSVAFYSSAQWKWRLSAGGPMSRIWKVLVIILSIRKLELSL